MHHPAKAPLHYSVLLCALLATPLFAQSPASPVPSSSASRHYAIPAGPLEAALNQFGQHAGILLSFPTTLTQGRSSPGLQGEYSVEAGLARLLSGTGLRAVRAEDGGYSLTALPGPLEGTALDTVTVTAQRERSAVTEYSGLYTASGPSTTATRLELDMQQTPQSISVITRQQIEDLGLQTIDDVLLHTTGVTAATAAVGGGYQFTSRGFNITNMQVDGLQGSYREAGRGPFNASVLDSVLYDRVEVVRGATGLITGVGDPSATINMIRKRPEKVFTGTLSAAVGSWDHRRLIADLSVPITEDGRVRARLIGAYKEADSFRKFRSDEQTTLSGTLEVDLTARTMLTLGHDFQRTDLDSESNTGLPLFDSNGKRIDVSRSKTVAPPWTYWNKRYSNTFVYLNHEFANGWKAKAAYSRNKNTGDAVITANRATALTYVNPDGSGIPIRPDLAANGYRYQDNFEIHANGPFTLFGREHQLTVGANGTRSRDTNHTMRFDSTADYWIPDIYDWDGGMPEPGVSRSGAKTRTLTRQHGLYTGARFNVSDPLKLIVGARLSSYKTERDNYNTAGQFTGTDAKLRNDDELTPFVGITYDLHPAFTVYASYAEIFKPQNYRDRNNDYLDPIVGDNVELGFKASLLQNRLKLNFAVFEAQQDNIAVIDDSVPVNSLPDGAQAYVSSGKGNKSRGFELEASGHVTRNWQIFAAYSDTITRDANGQTINTYIPRRMLKLGTSYQFNGALRGLSLASTVHWQDKRDMWTAGRTLVIPGVGTVSARHASYAVVGLHAGYRINDQWQATLNINNLFDKKYYDNFVAFRAQYGAPRNAQLALRYQW
ncbi:TonB-dependent siderophore receptor [Pseudothauera nasutitermitis]|nr:TonB-dependent receptor [Pseudothauera nasutitermitis]